MLFPSHYQSAFPTLSRLDRYSSQTFTNMSEQHDQRLLCPGCSHSIQEQNPPPEAFRYLTINEMKAAGYRCQNFVCYIYIEEDEIFTEDTDTVSNWTNSSPALYVLTLMRSSFSEFWTYCSANHPQRYHARPQQYHARQSRRYL